MTMEQQLQYIIENMATKAEIQDIKTDIQGIKAEIWDMKTEMQLIKKQGEETFNELMKVEKVVGKMQDDITDLKVKYDTLLLTGDNTALLLNMVTDLQDRVTDIELKRA